MKMVAAPNGIRLLVSKDYGSMSLQAARLIAREAKARPNLLVCASAGASWAGCYEELGQQARRDPEHFQRKVRPPVAIRAAMPGIRAGHRNPHEEDQAVTEVRR